MKAKLIKTDQGNYVLIDPTKGTYDKGYLLGSSRECDVNKLSVKNCQIIERGYDLDELAMEVCDCEANGCDVRDEFKAGFQKCLELIGDKKFTRDDLSKAIDFGIHLEAGNIERDFKNFKSVERQFIYFLGKNEWDVEIEMEPYREGDFINDGKTHSFEVKWRPVLDDSGCLILKKL